MVSYLEISLVCRGGARRPGGVSREGGALWQGGSVPPLVRVVRPEAGPRPPGVQGVGDARGGHFLRTADTLAQSVLLIHSTH